MSDSNGGAFGNEFPVGDGASRVHLSEAAQAVEDVLSGCRAELRFLRERLKGSPGDTAKEEKIQTEADEDKPSGEDHESPPTPRKQALHIAARLEACAGALRKANSPEGPDLD